MATLSDITGSLPIPARGIATADALRYLNDDVRNDIRDEVYQTFSSAFTASQTVSIVLPATATVALGTGVGNLDNAEYRYRIAFVSPVGESKAGKQSSVVTVIDNATNGKIELTAIPTGGTSTTARKVYRQKNGYGDFLLVGTISDNTTTTYSDNVAQSGLGAKCKEGYSLATDFYDWLAVKYGNLDVPVVERSLNGTYPSKFSCMIDYTDNPDGTSSKQLFIPDDFPYTGDIEVVYRRTIADANDTSALPYPLSLHDKLLPVLRLGVAFYHLSELSGEENEAAKVGDRYDTARANVFIGGISQTY